MVNRARKLAEEGDDEQAVKLYIKVLEEEPRNTGVMDRASELLLKLGYEDYARQLLARSITLSPDGGYNKHVLLAGLEGGAGALERLQTALHLLEDDLRFASAASEAGSASRAAHARARMACVLTAMARVAVSDLGSVEEGKGHLQRALELDEGCEEAARMLADLRDHGVGIAMPSPSPPPRERERLEQGRQAVPGEGGGCKGCKGLQLREEELRRLRELLGARDVELHQAMQRLAAYGDRGAVEWLAWKDD
mmetsp:Transcript_13724/g.43404  ORF Transcript_13724/g.43404 Transcript_13724/m.43404 type:complete len:252 (+) Transcript_13724:650-1405(+)